MGFGMFFLGIGCGVTLPFVVHKNLSKAMAVCFLQPNMKYRIEKERRDPNLAIDTARVDAYILDVGKSTLLFFILLGPVLYRTYYLKEGLIGEEPEDSQERMVKAEDSYSTMLR